MDHSHSTGQSMALPRTRYRLSKDISFDNALGLRNHNAQSVPLLPPDHPHAKSHGTENMAPSSTERPRTSRREEIDDGIKEHKRSKSTVSLRSLVGGGDSKKPKDKASRTKDRSSDKKSQSPKKTMKKSKSSTGLASLFGVRNKSSKDLTALAADTQGPIASPSQDTPLQTPIWAQFATQQPDHIESHSPTTQPRVRADVSDERILNVKNEIDRYTPKEYDPTRQRDFVGIKPALSRPTSSHRPQSTIISGTASRVDDLQRALLATQRAQLGSRGSDSSTGAGRIDRSAPSSRPQSMHWDLHRHNSGPSTEQVPAHDIAVTKRGSRVAAAVAAINNKVASPRKAEPPKLDPQQVEQAFEAVLERRNIPEDQRRSMRSLTLHVKADFVRQDEKTSRPSSPVKADIPNPFDQQAKAQDEATEARSPTKRERNRSRSRTRAFQFSKSDSSPSKKQRSASRPRSMQDASQLTRTDTNNSQTSERGRSSSVGRSAARVALPEDYVGYLRAMKDPRQAEVGRVHKLRILLRNETVTWVDAFVSLGGMSEIIALLYRIMEIEWREDHEDQLLHETLLCLKGISTTHLALQKLAEVADELFPKLLGMIFDEEKKGPSEFTTRGVIVAVLCKSYPHKMHRHQTTLTTHLSRTSLLCLRLRPRRPRPPRHPDPYLPSRLHEVLRVANSAFRSRDAYPPALPHLDQGSHQRHEGGVLDLPAPRQHRRPGLLDSRGRLSPRGLHGLALGFLPLEAFPGPQAAGASCAVRRRRGVGCHTLSGCTPGSCEWDHRFPP